MKAFFRFFAERHLFANLITIMIVLLGVAAAIRINRSEFHKVDMGIMTVTTHQLIFTNRVSGGLIGLGPYILVAAIAYFGLFCAFQYLAGFMNKMAVYTGHVLCFMVTGKPA